ncbi:methyl-accepting chemotaxis protein [Natronomonas pharaonis]|nr:methyl-accepting chemotaxis protein [Natronomonas pharaonis]
MSVRSAAARIVPDRIRQSYLLKFAVAVVLVLAVTLGAGIVIQQAVADDLEDDIHDEMETIAMLEADKMEAWFEERSSSARVLSANDDFGTEGPAGNEALLTALDRTPADVESVHVLDLDADEITDSTDPNAEGQAVSERIPEWWVEGQHPTALAPSEATMSEDYEVGDTEYIAFVSPLGADEETGLGSNTVLALEVNADVRAETFQDRNEDIHIQATDSRGVAEFYVDEDRIYELEPDDEHLERSLIGITRSFEDDDTVVAMAAVDGTDWVIVASAPRAAVYGLHSSVITYLSVLIGIFAVGLVVFSVGVGRDITGTLRDLTGKAERLEAGDLDVDIRTGRTDEFGELYGAFDSMRGSLRTRLSEVEDAQAEAEAAQREATQLNEHLETKAREYTETMEAAAAGDLTREMDPESESEAMQEIGETYNAMMTDIREIVRQVQRFADELEATIEEVAVGIEDVEEASEDVSASVQSISAGTDEQLTRVRNASDELSDLSATVEEIAASADNVAETSQQTAERGADGRKQAAEALDAIEEIETTMEEGIEQVESLEAQIAEIDDIIEVIDDIAQETNILALNASIEAANADGDSEGFAVVADEVKSLAEKTAESTAEIADRIESVEETTETTVDLLYETGDRVDSGTETIEEAVASLETIVELVEEADEGMQSINQATDEQARTTEDVVTDMERVEDICSETTDDATDVASAAEEQTAIVSEVSDELRAVSSDAAGLRSLADEFDTGVGTAAVETAASTTGDDAGPDDDTEADPAVDAGDDASAAGDAAPAADDDSAAADGGSSPDADEER